MHIDILSIPVIKQIVSHNLSFIQENAPVKLIQDISQILALL